MVMRTAEGMETSVFHPAKFNRASFLGFNGLLEKRDELHADNFRKPKIPGRRSIQVHHHPAQQLQVDLGFGLQWVQPYLPSRLTPSSWVADSGSGDKKQFPNALN